MQNERPPPTARGFAIGPSLRLRLAAPGLLLLLPWLGAGAAGPPPDAAVWPYVIERGDTLIGLQQRLLRPGARWQDLQRLNRIADPRRLRPGSTLRIPVDWLLQQDVSAELLHTHGSVTLERNGSAPRAAVGGDTLLSGDLLVTGAQSSATLRFADGTRLLLRPGSRLRVERHARHERSGSVDSRVGLDQGGIEVRVPADQPVKPRFDVRTPVANLGVRGTEFRARSEGARTLTEVLSGGVGVGPQRLGAGFGNVATAAGAAAPTPLPTAPQLSGAPTLVERLPLALPFAAAGASDGPWRAMVLQAGPEGRLLLDGLFDAPQAQWPVSPPDGDYVLRVRRADAQGLEGPDTSIGFRIKARPEPPFLTQPDADASLTQPMVRFAWSRHPEAQRYHLQVADDPGFATPRVDRSDLTGTEFTSELPEGRHHWRVRSVRAGNDAGPWSTPQSLQRIAPPPPPPPPPPGPPGTQAPERSGEGLRIRWLAATGTDVRYRLQLARDPAFTQLVLDETTDQTSWLLPAPAPGTYHLRVQSLSAGGQAGAFGPPQVLEVPRSWPAWLLLLPLLLLL